MANQMFLLAAGVRLGLFAVQKQHARTYSQQSCRSMHHLQTAAPVADVAEGLEAPVQLVYLVTLLGFLVVGAYLVVRQVCSIRVLEMLPTKTPVLCLTYSQGQHDFACILQALVTRELEEAAKTLGDRVRQKDATCEVSASCQALRGWLLMHPFVSAAALFFATLQQAERMLCVLCHKWEDLDELHHSHAT